VGIRNYLVPARTTSLSPICTGFRIFHTVTHRENPVFSTCYPQVTWGNVSSISRRQGGSRQCQLTLGWDVLTCAAAAPRGRTGDAQHRDSPSRGPVHSQLLPLVLFSAIAASDLICD
jgi:hypothetical protein